MRFTHSPSQQPLTPLPHRRRPADLARALLIATLLLMTGAAAGAEEGFRQPSQSLTQLIDAPANPWVIETPDGNGLMVIDRPSLPAIDELAEPELRLAGLRINPRIDTRSRERYGSGLSYIRLEDGGTRQIEGLPADLRWNGFDFSPDGSKVALTHVAEDRAELWIADLETFKAHRLIDRALHLVAGNRPAWLDDSTLVATLVPENRAAPPQPPRVPRGPVVRENLGVKAQARTYQDLLANPHDEALFAHHMSAQIARIGLDGSVEALGEPALVWDVEPSPDGRFLLVQTLQRPFSYLVPAFRFARTVEILDRDGQRVAQLAELPLAESVPLAYGSVPTGLRSASWRHDAPATVAWAEAQDGGDAGSEAEIRDRLFMLAAPFEAEPTPWVDLALRYAGTTWGHDGLALITSSWWQTRQVQVHWAQPGQPDAEPSLVVERSFEDRYGDPGSPLTVTGKFGRPVLQHPKGQPAVLYLAGNGASPEGDRPFLDRHDLESGEKTRLFRSEAPYFELPIAVLEGDESLLTRRESVDEPPNYRVRELDGDASRAVTRFPHPAEQLAGVQKELVTYPREDGVQLSATLYLPAGYDAERDGPLPMLMWAYPQEFKSASAAGQVTDSPHRFNRISWASPMLWVSRGYAVFDDPKMPIIGEGETEPNDTFRDQLVSSARAAVDEVVRRGVADRDRIAIGGHSYGAFMTANLLAHSDLFAAGIARSGAYNRTLTPFGFQSEQRTFWQAPDVYFTMSPFMHAEKIEEPILLIHGAADNNSGTFPMQSERFYHALKGHGATARLVMLEHESHGYRARESILHMMWETDAWLERYVKNAAPSEGGEEKARAAERKPAAAEPAAVAASER